MSRLGPIGRLTALAMAVVLVFALAGSGVGTDARLVDSEVATVPVVVFGAAPDDESGLVGTPLTLTFEGLTSETADWPGGFTAVADDAATASFSVASAGTTDSTGESNETTDAPAEPVYVVRLDSVGSDSVRFTLAGDEQTPATVAVDGDLLARALGLSAFDSASVELRIDGTVTGYDTTAGGTVQFRTSDWADRTVTFRAVESESPVADPGTETPTTNETTEEPTDEPNGTTEAPTEGTPTEAPAEETPTETTPTEIPTETPTEETPAETTPTETPTEAPTEETPSETTTTESPPAETPTEEPVESTPTESPKPTESTTESGTSDSSNTTDSESSPPPAEAGE